MKKFLIPFIVLALYVVISILIIGLEGPNKIFVLDSDTIIDYSSKEWKILEDNKYLKGKFNIYDKNANEYIKSGKVFYNSNLYVNIEGEDKEFSSVDVIAIKGDKPSFVNYDIDYNVTSAEIKNVLSAAKLTNEGFIMAYKIDVNLDSDSENETLYFINNCEEYEEKIKKYFSIAYLKDGNNYIKVSEVISNEIFLKTYNIYSILDFKNDKNYEIIISRFGYDSNLEKVQYTIYSYNKGNIEELIKVN